LKSKGIDKEIDTIHNYDESSLFYFSRGYSVQEAEFHIAQYNYECSLFYCSRGHSVQGAALLWMLQHSALLAVHLEPSAVAVSGVEWQHPLKPF
jgi:hypothetical protein